MKRFLSNWIVFLVLILSWSCTDNNAKNEDLKAIGYEAFIYAYPMMEQVKTVNQMLTFNNVKPNVINVNKVYPMENVGQPIVMNNVTSMTGGGLIDISGGPVTLEIPEIKDRLVVYQFIDVFTHNFFYAGTIADGGEAGTFIFHNNTQQLPEDNSATPVLMEGDHAVLVSRVDIKDRSEMDMVISKYDQLQITSAPSSIRDYPVYDVEKAFSPQFVEYVNELLIEIPPSEKALFKRFEKIGIMNEVELNEAQLSQIQAGIDSAFATIQLAATEEKVANDWIAFASLFGDRKFIGENYLKRALGAYMGLWGNSKEQAIYLVLETEGEGSITFTKDELPPLTDIGFWSITPHDGNYYLVENEYDSYVLTMDQMQFAEDGSLTVNFSSTPEEGNWVYVTGEKLVITLRAYAADPEKITNYAPPPFIKK